MLRNIDDKTNVQQAMEGRIVWVIKLVTKQFPELEKQVFPTFRATKPAPTFISICSLLNLHPLALL